MAVRIRLTRVGATKRPSYRVIAIDGRRPRDGRALEILGFYDPLTDPATVELDAERIRGWLQKGASPSETVVRLMRQAGMPEAGKAPGAAAVDEKPKRASRSGAQKAEAKPARKADATPEKTDSDAASGADEPSADEAGAEAAGETADEAKEEA